jgi:hypothetical protein
MLGQPKSRDTTSHQSWRVLGGKPPLISSAVRNENSMGSRQMRVNNDTTGKINPDSRRNSLEKLLTFQPDFQDRKLRQLNKKLFRAMDGTKSGPHIRTLPFKFFSGHGNAPI